MCTTGSLVVVTSELCKNRKEAVKVKSLTFGPGSCWNSSEANKNLVETYYFKALSPTGSYQIIICMRLVPNNITKFAPKSTFPHDHTLSLILPCQPLDFSFWPFICISYISRCAVWFILSLVFAEVLHICLSLNLPFLSFPPTQ